PPLYGPLGAVYVSRYGDPRGLHSFPTRRSSDLAAALVAGEGQEVGEQLGEDSGIVDEVVEQACHHLFDLLVETVALGFVLIAPAHGCGGDLVEQATGRMAATAEEGLV